MRRGEKGKENREGPQARRSGRRIKSVGVGQRSGGRAGTRSFFPRSQTWGWEGQGTLGQEAKDLRRLFLQAPGKESNFAAGEEKGSETARTAGASHPQPPSRSDPRGGRLLRPGSHSQNSRLCLRLLPAPDSSLGSRTPPPLQPCPPSALSPRLSGAREPARACSAAVPCSPWGRPSTGTETVRLSSLLRLDSLLRSRIRRGCI